MSGSGDTSGDGSIQVGTRSTNQPQATDSQEKRMRRIVPDDDDAIEDDEVVPGTRSLAQRIAGDELEKSSSSTVATPIVQVVRPASEDSGSDKLRSEHDDHSGKGDGATFHDVLSELPESSGENHDGMISGIRVRRGIGGSESESTTSEEGPPPELPRTWVGGQARGYTMLYAVHPRARAVVESNVRALLESHIRQVYVGVLIDGTFGNDPEYLRSIITRLSTEGRSVTLALYLSNGPTMRRGMNTGIPHLFNGITPESLRDKIRQRDPDIRARLSRVVNQAEQLFAFNRSRNPSNTNVAIAMLEDNLNRESYRALRAIVAELSQVAIFVRNPCVGCYPGNDGDSLGDSREEHTLSKFGTLARGDAFSLDGLGFAYPNEAPGSQLSYDQALAMMQTSYDVGLRYVGLWRFGWQGIVPGQMAGNPANRNYVPATPEQEAWEIQLLRYGLPVEDPSASSIDTAGLTQ